MGLIFAAGTDKVSYGADTTAFTAFTGMVWAKVTTITDRAGLFSKSASGSTDHFSIIVESTTDTMKFTVGDEGFSGTAPDSSLVAAAWAHWAFVFDGAGVGNAGRLKAWKDGASLSLTYAGTIPATTTTGSATVTGGFYTRSGIALAGSLANLKCWSAALTEGEVQQEMNSSRPARTANLWLWSPYDDGTSSRDYSGNARHGTVTGALAADAPSQANGAVKFI